MTTRNSPAMDPSPAEYVVSSQDPSAAISPPAVFPAWLVRGTNEIEPPPAIGLPSNVTFPRTRYTVTWPSPQPTVAAKTAATPAHRATVLIRGIRSVPFGFS